MEATGQRGGGGHDGGRENRRTVFIRIRICQAVSGDLREGFQPGEGKESDSQGVSSRQDAGDSSDALFKILGQSRNKQQPAPWKHRGRNHCFLGGRKQEDFTEERSFEVGH